MHGPAGLRQPVGLTGPVDRVPLRLAGQQPNDCAQIAEELKLTIAAVVGLQEAVDLTGEASAVGLLEVGDRWQFGAVPRASNFSLTGESHERVPEFGSKRDVDELQPTLTSHIDSVPIVVSDQHEVAHRQRNGSVRNLVHSAAGEHPHHLVEVVAMEGATTTPGGQGHIGSAVLTMRGDVRQTNLQHDITIVQILVAYVHDREPGLCKYQYMSTAMNESPAASRDLYERNGYAIFREVVDPQLVEEGRQHVEWLRRRHPDLRPEKLGTRLVADDPFWVRLVSDERLLDIAEQFVGRDIALFASHYIAKPPLSGQAVLWHQDGGFWPLEPMEVVTLWLALDETDHSNGCLRVIPGTHRWELRQSRPRVDVANLLNAEIDVDPAMIKDESAVDIALHAGDVEVHHPNLVHGSHANTSDRWRRGLTIRYIPTSTRITSEQPWPSAFLLRGTPVPGINEYRPRPSFRASDHMAFVGCEHWRH